MRVGRAAAQRPVTDPPVHRHRLLGQHRLLGDRVSGPVVADLAEDLAERTRAAVAQQVLDDALLLVIELAVEARVCDYAGVTQRIADGSFQTAAPSHPLVVQADVLQYDLQEGPCVLASIEGDIQGSPDVAADPRWPRWGPQATSIGVLSALSVQLYTDTNTAMGALNLYSATVRRYTGADIDLARLIGAHASVALAHFRGEAHLWTAVDARHRIGMAQGILMHKFGVTAEQAFSYLRRRSQAENVKLHLIADAVVNDPTDLVLQ